ncbi:hypothetical protein FB451DRAFT_1476649 [Mycena latifolia]|nr:hypothetical protein FB451DRAFT_1476649 [Mycena latifolia]
MPGKREEGNKNVTRKTQKSKRASQRKTRRRVSSVHGVQENARLRETLARYRGVVRKAERERDELRDTVVEFFEKDPIAPLPLAHPASMAREGTDPRWDYAAHTIRSLRAELEAERRDHAATRAGVRRLEAKLARVEAEICVCSASGALILGGGISAAQRHGEELGGEEQKQEMRALLAHKSAQNRALEAEGRWGRGLKLKKRRYSASDAGAQPQAEQERSRLPTRPSSDSAAPLPDGGSSVDPLRRRRPSSSRRRRSLSRARPGSSPTAAPVTDAVDVGIEAFQIEREELRLQVLEAEGNARDEPREQGAQSQVPQFTQAHTQPVQAQPTMHPAPQATLVAHPHPPDDSDGERSMELATPLVASVILPAPHLYSHLHLPSAVRAPTPHPYPPAMEMSPLDLTAELPAPSSQPDADRPGEPTDAASEQAVQELMDLAAARRRNP